MYRSNKLGQNDDLLLCKSSYGDLKDGKSAVDKEGKTDDEVRERQLKIHEIESDEESY